MPELQQVTTTAKSPISNFNWSNMAGSLGGSLLGGLIGLIGGHQQNKYNQKLLKQQYQYNQLLAEQEYQRNLQQWQRENEYNSPMAQMARLQQAGINPHLAYSKGTINNVASSSPQYNSPTYGFTPSASYSQAAMQGMGTFNAAVSQALQNGQLSVQTDYVKAQTRIALAKALGQETDNEIKRYLKESLVETGKNQAKLSTLAVQKQEFETQIAEFDRDIKKLEKDFQGATYDLRVSKAQELVKNLVAQRISMISQTALTGVQASLTKVQLESLIKSGGYTGDAGNVVRLVNTILVELGLEPFF
ncbi:DNA pilot protein [Dipodfec virus UA06Rod_19]|uniref:DNA pilot protein n=1 Tax=Dipodfec virus UA06Rod_19 TaxID=2929319 RepID=A0A976R8P3_9VIRU|nr:DNA pilot protein [Dipodfec virus UA06Rod_19]